MPAKLVIPTCQVRIISICHKAMLKESEVYNQIEVSSVILFLAFYAIMSAYLEHKKLPIHRGAVAIIIGIGVGLFISIFSKQTYNRLVELNETIIFTILLPPMLFARGYTFKKNAFIKNLKFIAVFGALGTFISYAVISSLIYAANELNLIRDAKDINVIRTLSVWEVLLFSACLCSIETGASEEAVDEDKYPKIYSILTGEGIMKDCVTIVLFRSILNLEEMEDPKKFIFYWWTSLVIIRNFIITIVGSIAFGVVAAMLITYLVKKSRFLLHDKGVSQTTVLFLIGYATYILTEIATFSGIISILTFGVVLNRYNCHNLSQEGSQTSKNTFLFVSVICEGLLYLIMGLMVWEVDWDKDTPSQHMTHSYVFCMVVICILVIGRLVNVYLMWLMARFISPTFKMKKQELKILFVSGIVRGATPFALFTSVQFKQGSTHYGRNEGLILKTTIIIVTMFSSIILNSIIPRLYSQPLAEISKAAKAEMMLSIRQIQRKSEQNSEEDSKKSKFYLFQEERIKPLLIYHYNQRKEQLEKQKYQQKTARLKHALDKMLAEVDSDDEDNCQGSGEESTKNGIKQSLLSSEAIAQRKSIIN